MFFFQKFFTFIRLLRMPKQEWQLLQRYSTYVGMSVDSFLVQAVQQAVPDSVRKAQTQGEVENLLSASFAEPAFEELPPLSEYQKRPKNPPHLRTIGHPCFRFDPREEGPWCELGKPCYWGAMVAEQCPDSLTPAKRLRVQRLHQ